MSITQNSGMFNIPKGIRHWAPAPRPAQGPHGAKRGSPNPPRVPNYSQACRLRSSLFGGALRRESGLSPIGNPFPSYFFRTNALGKSTVRVNNLRVNGRFPLFVALFGRSYPAVPPISGALSHFSAGRIGIVLQRAGL